MAYQPVVRGRAPLASVTALVGMHTVVLGFDYRGTPASRRKLLGFAMRRADLTANESWWLTGQIRFKGLTADAGEAVATNVAPLQKFRWGDYTAKPGKRYRYWVHPVFGSPHKPDLETPAVVEVTTTSNGPGAAEVYFNRGVTAALAYRQRFGDVAPAKVPHGAAYKWLTRGLEDALLGFIAGAERGDELKVAIYEFEHEDVIGALRAAKARGVRIWIVYHAPPRDTEQTPVNTRHVKELGLAADRVVMRTNVPKISHNKFIVHVRGGTPLRVWTGSTNFTESGFFLQTNVGLVFHERSVARAFDAYFAVLRQDLEEDDMRARVAAAVAAARRRLPEWLTLYFSPVKGAELLDAAVDVLMNARTAVFISSPFGLDKRVVEALNDNRKSVLELGLVNTTNRKRLLQVIDRSIATQYASPTWVKTYDGRMWDAKAYGNHKIHVKAMVADPWGPNARVLVGSANFSDESVNDNDENAFLVENAGRSAAIAATEFLRVFEHYKFRDYARRAKTSPRERFLAEDGSWTEPYFDPKHPKCLDRRVFAQEGS